jgi:hypothetical protein
VLVENDISDLTHTTDTGPSPDCTGTTTYQDGEGFCDDISTVYEAADTNIAKVNANEVITGDWDFSGGGIEIENGTTPPSCTTGQIYLDTDATSGQQFMACEGGTFVQQGGSGSDTLADLSCSTNQIAKYNGSAWVCAADDNDGGTSGFVSVPAAPSSTCTAGTYSADLNYFYACYATNSWKRTAITTWTETYYLLDENGYNLTQETAFRLFKEGA